MIRYLLLTFGLAAAAQAALPVESPSSLGFDPERLARLDVVISQAIQAKDVPGAVVIVGREGRIAYRQAFGDRSVEPSREPMTIGTKFDMASLTKPVATATSIMILLEQGKIRLDDRLGQLLPEFNNHGKGAITVEQLLRHRAGFIADNPIKDYGDGPDSAWKRLADLELTYSPGSGYVYSDVGFLTLGKIVERVSGMPLDAFARQQIFEPLGMSDSGFNPEKSDSIAPTEPADGQMLRGIVHDPRSRALGGVAGHAGLFSTADDIAVYAQSLLNGGLAPNGHRLLGPRTVRAMIDPTDTPDGQRRGLGWDVDTPHSSPRGGLFAVGGFGHTGFTGTSLWADPESGVFVIVLTSRLHPDGKRPAPTSLRYRVATVVAAALVEPGRKQEPSPRPDKTSSNSEVLCGVDVLARDGFLPLRGKRVGLVTNHTGLSRDGKSTIDLLNHAEGVRLVALFSPEHGIRGSVDAKVADSKDNVTGLPIFSLYGETRKPTAESLKNVDVLVYDIQDIGCRFYTYMSTLGLVMEAAKERGIPVLVLDRPNPIGGIEVAGPVRDDRFESFIAFHAIPVRHGMTLGELAGLFNAERAIAADLTVVKCEGWRREATYDKTGLLWVNPSPNMRSLTEALIYPGIGLLEATNLATGRGTDTPFERVGAPYIDPRAFASAMNELALPGVSFAPIRFTPKERQFAGVECGGVYVMLTARERFEPVALGVGMATVLRRLYPKDWKPEGLERFIADDAAYKAIVNGGSLAEVQAVWRLELDEFRRASARYRLYP